jgi:hypothetical protein
MKTERALISLLAAALVAVCGADANACAVPVFRYALERWEPDTFLVVVRHRESLTTPQRALVEKLRDVARDSARPANVDVVVLDNLQAEAKTSGTESGDAPTEEPASADAATTAATPEVTEEPPSAAAATTAATPEVNGELRGEQRRQWLEILEKIDAPPLDPAAKSPQMLLLMPLPGRPPWPVWSGPLTDANLRRLIDSPLRQTIVKRVLAGESAVWVLVASGQEEADKRAEETLRKELARMEKSLQLPSAEALAMEPSYRPDSAVELRIGFSVVVLKKDDPDEAIFRAMVLASEPDLIDFNEPITVPIFGRGRTYFALVGKGIHPDMIEENCRFLCDGCSCLIKQENPGVDMLLAVNWDAQIEGSAIPELVLPELTGIGEPFADRAALAEGVETAAEVATDAGATAAPESAPGGPRAGALGNQTTAAVTAAEAATTIATIPPSGAPAEANDRFGRQLLVWTLAGVGVAVLLVGVGSLWINSQRAARQ